MRYCELKSALSELLNNKCDIKLENLKELIEKLDSEQYTQWSCSEFDINYQFSIIYGKDIKIRESLLHLAVKFKSQKLVKYLLDNEANINILSNDILRKRPINFTLFPLFNEEMLIFLIERGASIGVIGDNRKSTPLIDIFTYINNIKNINDFFTDLQRTTITRIFKTLVACSMIKVYTNQGNHILSRNDIHDLFKYLWDDGQFQIKKMAEDKVGDNQISCLDLIKASYNFDHHLLNVNDQDIHKILNNSEYMDKYPIYSTIIKNKFTELLKSREPKSLLEDLSARNTSSDKVVEPRCLL